MAQQTPLLMMMHLVAAGSIILTAKMK